MTTPYPEGPGLPRAPPSLKATRRSAGGFSWALNSSLVVRDWEYEGMAKVYTPVVDSAEICSARTGGARPPLFQIVVEPSRQAIEDIAPVLGLEELVSFAGIDDQLRFHA
jgi:hypothetical protein